MFKQIIQRLGRERARGGVKGFLHRYTPREACGYLLLAAMGIIAQARLAVANRLARSNVFVRLFRMPLVRRFNRLYFLLRRNTFDRTYFMGKHVQKYPTDLWTYQEILHECRPDVIVETGVFLGGSTYYFAKLCEWLGRGRVIAIDTSLAHVDPEVRVLPTVTLIEGSSVDRKVFEQVQALIQPGERVMVVLDADHRPGHVYPEMKLYAALVTQGQYLVVEDGIINRVYPLLWRRRGPMSAIRRFLAESPDFIADHYRTRFLLTHSPSGYLLRAGPAGRTAREEDNLRPLQLQLSGIPPDAPWRGLLGRNNPQGAGK